MKSVLKKISLLLVTLSIGCATTNTNNSKISFKVNITDNTYTFACRFSKQYLSKVKNIIIAEYPNFYDSNFQTNNPKISIVLRNNKRLEIVHQQIRDRDKDFNKIQRITQRIKKLKS